MRGLFASSFVVLLYGVFLHWYYSDGTAVTDSEFQEFIEGIDDKILIDRLRAVKDIDDGKEFFMVNLVKWREFSTYPKESVYNTEEKVSFSVANARYSKIIMPELFSRGSHPFFFSNTIDKGFFFEDGPHWNTTAVVRYRSFKDSLMILQALYKNEGWIHKFAAIEVTHVMPTRVLAPFTYIIPTVVGVLISFCGFFVYVLTGYCC